MTDSCDFEIVCPNNHNQTVRFTKQSFEDKLKSDSLLFHCNTCDTNWTPTSDEIAEIRKKLSNC